MRPKAGSSSSRALRVYVGLTAALSLVAGGWFIRRWGAPNAFQVVFFAALFTAANWTPVEAHVTGITVPGRKTRPPVLTAGFLVLMAAAFATSPATAAIIGATTSVAPRSWRGPLRSVFNAAQESLYAGLASATFFFLRGVGEGALGWIVGAATAAAVAVVVNHGLVAGGVSIDRGKRVSEVWRELLWTAPHSLAFAFPALLVAIAYQSAGAPAAALIVTPIVVLRHARRAKMELENAYVRTLQAFVRTVELKDPYTSRHSERVATIAVELHRVLGASSQELERRYRGALLHDLGKVAVSGRVLGKPTSLTREEFDDLKRHPMTGALIVNQVEFLRDVVPEVLYHHERIDGTGYPEGLCDDDIPHAARVLAVADTFEALTADRPYRRARTTAEALAEIRRVAGTQLDSDAVEALEGLLNSGQAFPALTPRVVPLPKSRPEPVAREA